VAANRQLDARGKALANRLLVDADAQGFPLKVLADPVESTAKTDWRQRYARAMSEVLHDVERRRSDPTGPRRHVRAVLGFFSDWLPPLAFVAALILFLLIAFRAWGEKTPPLEWMHFVLPFAVLLAVLVVLHILIVLLLPMRWAAIRGEFQALLQKRLQQELEGVYGPVPDDVAALLQAERRQVEKLAAETRDVSSWLRHREESASVAGLYGK